MSHTTKKKSTEDTALTEFDILPNSMIIRQKTVVRLLACSDSTLWRYVQRGLLRPVRLSPGVTGFLVGEIRELIAAHTASAA